jgi:hypothetical protein
VTGSPASLPDLTSQVGTFLTDAGNNASTFSNSNTLVAVWTGLDSLIQLWSNDLNTGNTSGEGPLVTQLSGIVTAQMQSIRNSKVFASPPTILLITNPPAQTAPLAISDAGGDTGSLSDLTTLGQQFNSELLSGAAGISAQTWDASAFFQNLTSNPAAVSVFRNTFLSVVGLTCVDRYRSTS